jgi:hypothetical protein
VCLALGLALFMRSSYVTFRTNQITNERLPLSPALLEALKTDPAHTAVNNVLVASVLNMVLPRQHATALGHDQTFIAVADQRLPIYRAAKQRILLEHPEDPGFQRTLSFLDSAYEYCGQNIDIVNIHRKTTFKKVCDVNAVGDRAEAPPLKYFFVR